ncbi:MAG: hypothetical protein VX617_02315 [Pseudomonadota bacterium]|nr:hypothetical protein [Pseudomonadota bacterium]
MQTGNLDSELSVDAAWNTNWTGVTGMTHPDTASLLGGAAGKIVNRSLIEPLHRIQSANFNFTINRQDINEFGKLSRLDSIVMESPTVGLDFNYYLCDGGNERKMGFNLPTNNSGSDGIPIGVNSRVANQAAWTGDGCVSGYSALSGLIEDTQGNNYFIVTSKEGTDVQGDTVTSTTTDFDVIGIGNGFISDYSIDASVGAVPTASVTVEAFNIRVDDTISGYTEGAFTGNQVPGVNDTDGQQVNINYQFDGGTLQTTGDYITGMPGRGTPDIVADNTITALRPGDILLEFLNPESSTFNNDGFTVLSGDGKAHIQSFGVSVPMSRTVLGRLGNTFGYARVIDLPLNLDVSISAIVSELRVNNLFERLASPDKVDFRLTLRRSAGTGKPGADAMVIDVKGARLEGESYSNSIGDNETVDITFSTQVGGANDTSNGIFMRGSYDKWRTMPYWVLGDAKTKQGSWSGTGGMYNSIK